MTVTPRTLAFEDRVLAILRNEELPMTTQQIVETAGRVPCWCRNPQTSPDYAKTVAEHHAGRSPMCTDGSRRVYYGDVYPRLVRLEKAGQVTGLRMPDGRVYWSRRP